VLPPCTRVGWQGQSERRILNLGRPLDGKHLLRFLGKILVGVFPCACLRMCDHEWLHETASQGMGGFKCAVDYGADFTPYCLMCSFSRMNMSEKYSVPK